MNKQEQIDFIDQLINNVKNEIKDQVNANAPANWDGIKLRQFIADSFNEVVMKGTMSRSRRIAYNNTMLCMPRQ